MSCQLPPPPHFPVYSSIYDAACRWNVWFPAFKLYLSAGGISDDAQQRDLLQYIGGPDIQQVVRGLSNTGTDLATLEKAISDFFASKTASSLSRYQFRQITQQPGEHIDAWYARLCQQADLCAFGGNKDSAILDQLVAGCSSRSLRRALLQVDALDLEKALAKARSFEAAEVQDSLLAAAATDGARTHAPTLAEDTDIAAVSSRRSRSEPDWATAARASAYADRARPSDQGSSNKVSPTDHETRPSAATVRCYRCGAEGHQTCNKARGKQCSRCGKFNHFAKACLSSSERPQRVQGVSTLSSVAPTPDTPDPAREPAKLPTSQSVSDSEIATLHKHSAQLTTHDSARRTICLNGQPCRALIDSGASVNILSDGDFRALGSSTTLRNSSTKVYAYSALTPVQLQGECNVEVSFGSAKSQAVFLVACDPRAETVLGRSAAQQLGILHIADSPAVASVSGPDTPSTTSEPAATLPALLSRYSQRFQGLGRITDTVAHIHMPADAVPVAHPPSRVPAHLQDATVAELQLQLKLGIIEQAVGPTPWVARMVVVPKTQKGQVRLTYDFRDVNRQALRERHPIPTVEELTDQMADSAFFSELDLNKAFHQIELSPESQQIAVFSTPLGYMRCKRLVMGLASASEILQRTLDKVLAGLEGVKHIHDNIIVHAPTEATHLLRLEACLKRLEEFNVTLNLAKCNFMQPKITFLANIYSHLGVQPSPDHATSIQSFKVPRNATELRSFLGLANFLRRFVPNMATIAAPLNSLTRKNVPWHWPDSAQQAFDRIKSAIADQTILAYFDAQKATHLFVDASPVGLGAILCQSSPTDSTDLRPVAFSGDLSCTHSQ